MRLKIFIVFFSLLGFCACVPTDNRYYDYVDLSGDLRMPCFQSSSLLSEMKNTIIIPLDGCSCVGRVMDSMQNREVINGFNIIYTSSRRSDFYAHSLDVAACYAIDSSNLLGQTGIVNHDITYVNHEDRSIGEITEAEFYVLLEK